MIIENTQPYTGVTQPYTGVTQRLSPVVPQQSLTTVGIGLVTCGCAILAEQMIGPILWSLLTTSTFYRTLQIYGVWRGWIALAILCVGFAAYSVWCSNQRNTSYDISKWLV